MGNEPVSYSVLCVAGFGRQRNDDVQYGKIETHLAPIDRATVEFTYIGPNTFRPPSRSFDLRAVSQSNYRPITQLKQLFAICRLSYTSEYALIVSYSLFPYGLIALIGKRLSGTPAHLGILGMDLDVHEQAPYGVFVRWLFKQFDSISVAGTDYQSRLLACGVSSERIVDMPHPVDQRYVVAEPTDNPETDILWIGRMSAEKDPIRFVDIVDRLRDRGVYCQATMIGDGPLFSDVLDEIAAKELSDRISTPGWVADPLPQYQQSRMLVSTSAREMLPLTVVEGMHVGIPPVVPDLGGLPDLITTNQNGIIVSDRSPDTYADTIIDLLADEAKRQELAAAAPQIHHDFSPQAVAHQWMDILASIN